MPTETASRSHIDQALILWTVALLALPLACASHPQRIAKPPSEFGPLAVLCAAHVAISFAAPSFPAVGSVALLLLAASALFAIRAGGRAISRIDFLPTADD